MNHSHQSRTMPDAVASRPLGNGQVLPLGIDGGRLEVIAGSVWLTRLGDPADHFLAAGESIELAPSAGGLVEGSSRSRSAVVAWRPQPARRPVARACAAVNRCWRFMHPAARAGLGSAAAVIALALGGLVFGPLSAQRARELAGPSSLHNPGAASPGAPRPDAHADASRNDRRARLAAQEAGRRAPGAA